jgi:hypothetical protein
MKTAMEAMGKMPPIQPFTPPNIQLITPPEPTTIAVANSLLARNSPGQNQTALRQA